MATTVRSRKSKGRALQNFVRDRIIELFQFHPDDVQVAIMGESGVDIKLSPLARALFPFSPECKNQEKISVWEAIKQAESNAKPDTAPIVVFKRNRSRPYVIIDFDKFMDMAKVTAGRENRG